MRWIVLGFLFLLAVLNYTDKSVLGLAAEPIMSELNLSYDHFGLVGSSFFAAYAVGSIVLGTLTYRFNSKYLLMMIATGWTISLASAYFVETLTHLILLRVVLGFFEGGTLGLCIVHLARWFTSSQRGLAVAIMTSGTTIGTYLAAPLLVCGYYKFRLATYFRIVRGSKLCMGTPLLLYEGRAKDTTGRRSKIFSF